MSRSSRIAIGLLMLFTALWLGFAANTAEAQWGRYGNYGYQPYGAGYYGGSAYYGGYGGPYVDNWYDPGGYGYQPGYGYGYGPGYYPGFQAGYGYGRMDFSAREFGFGPGAALDFYR